MKKLVTVTTKDIINDLRETNDITLLYPLKSFCVGYEIEFDINEIDDFCLINRILTDQELDDLNNLLKNSNIKGIVFDDLGVLDLLKDMNITKILLLDHLATNSESINYYLDYVDSVIVSNDLTKDEIINIVNNVKKEIIINVFGLKTLMYSRRHLLTNYQTYHNINKNNNIKASIDDKKFIIFENEYGTKFYAYPYYNALELLDLNNIMYYWYDPIKLNKEDIINLVLYNDINNINCDKLFLNEKTYYKVGNKDE